MFVVPPNVRADVYFQIVAAECAPGVADIERSVEFDRDGTIVLQWAIVFDASKGTMCAGGVATMRLDNEPLTSNQQINCAALGGGVNGADPQPREVHVRRGQKLFLTFQNVLDQGAPSLTAHFVFGLRSD